MRVLACAVGFGLGPSGKLCSVVENNKHYECCLLVLYEMIGQVAFLQ